MKAKKKLIDGREYHVYGSTINQRGFIILSKEYTTSKGVVRVKNGIVRHPDGTETKE